MNLQRWQYTPDYAGGTFNNCRMDTLVNISQFGHPAVVPSLNITGTTVFTGAQLLAGSGGATQVNTLGFTTKQWATISPVALTWQPGDGIQFTTTGAQVALLLAGLATSGMGFGSGQTSGTLYSNSIRNGAQANVYVDGVLQTTVDCFGSTPQVTLFLDGASHVIKVAHAGYYNAAINPIGPIINTVGTSIGSNISITPIVQGGFLAGTWRVTCTTAGAAGTGKFKIEFAPQATGIFANVDTNLNVGTIYSGAAVGSGYAAALHVVGCTLLIGGTLTLNDVATFTTDQTMVAVQSATISTGTGSATGQYTSGVVDSGDAYTDWFLMEWIQDMPMGSVSFATGQTPAPDSSWVTTILTPDIATRTGVPATPGDTTLPVSKARYGMVGLAALPRGRFAQWSITFPAIATIQPYFRDLVLYFFVPERDPVINGNLAVGYNWIPGPNLLAITGTLAVTSAATRQAMLDFVRSYAINQSVDQYLMGYGTDLQQPRYSGEPPGAYQVRLGGSLGSRQQGGSIPTIAQEVNQLVNGQPNAVSTSVVAGKTQSTCGGVVVIQLTSQQYQVSIPPFPYAGLVGLSPAQAKTIITNYIATVLTSVNSVINPSNAGSYNIVFN